MPANIQRRYGVGTPLAANASELEIEFRSVQDKQQALFASLQQLVTCIFDDYRRNGYKNDKNINLLRSYFLLKNITDADRGFVETLADKRDELVKSVIQVVKEVEIPSVDTKEAIDDSGILERVNSEVAYARDFLDSQKRAVSDVVEIFKELVVQYVNERNKREDKSKSDDAIEAEYQIVDESHKHEIGQKVEYVRQLSATGGLSNVNMRKLTYAMTSHVLNMMAVFEGGVKSRKGSSHKAVPLLGTGSIGHSASRIGKAMQKFIRIRSSASEKITRSIKTKYIKAYRRKMLDRGSVLYKLRAAQKGMDKFAAATQNSFLAKSASGLSGMLGKTARILGPLTIVGGAAMRLVGTTLGFVGKVGGAIWSLSSKIVSGVVGATALLLKSLASPFRKMFESFVMTPMGAYLIGYLAGTMYKNVRDVGTEVSSAVKSVYDYVAGSVKATAEWVLDKFRDIGFFYQKLRRAGAMSKMKQFLSVFRDFLQSFTPEGMIRGGIHRAGAFALGALTSMALKRILYGALGVATAGTGGAALPLLLGSMVLIEGGTFLYEWWAKYNKDKIKKEEDKQTGRQALKDGRSLVLDSMRTPLSWRGDKTFQKSIGQMFGEFGKTTVSSPSNEQYMAEIFKELQNELEKDTFGGEQEKIEQIRDFVESKLGAFEKEREAISSLIAGFKSNGIDENEFRRRINRLAGVDIYVMRGKTPLKYGDLTNVTVNPLVMRLLNLAIQMGILEEIRNGKHIDEKQTPRDYFENELKKRAIQLDEHDKFTISGKTSEFLKKYNVDENLTRLFTEAWDYSRLKKENEDKISPALGGVVSRFMQGMQQNTYENRTGGGYTALKSFSFEKTVLMDMVIGKKTQFNSSVQLIGEFMELLKTKDVKDAISSRGKLSLNMNEYFAKLQEFFLFMLKSNTFANRFVECFKIDGLREMYSIGKEWWKRKEPMVLYGGNSKEYDTEVLLYVIENKPDVPLMRFPYIKGEFANSENVQYKYKAAPPSQTSGYCHFAIFDPRSIVREIDTSDAKIAKDTLIFNVFPGTRGLEYEQRLKSVAVGNFVDLILPYLEYFVKHHEGMQLSSRGPIRGGFMGDIERAFSHVQKMADKMVESAGVGAVDASDEFVQSEYRRLQQEHRKQVAESEALREKLGKSKKQLDKNVEVLQARSKTLTEKNDRVRTVVYGDNKKPDEGIAVKEARERESSRDRDSIQLEM